MILLKELTQAFGVAGREKSVREIVIREIKDYVDDLKIDALGNVIAFKKGFGAGKKIMLAAHMDEIGLQVIKIENDGRIKVCSVGWVWAASIYNSTVIFQNGITGVVGCDIKIEEANNDITKLYIDIGCTSKEDVLNYINIGDYCGFIGEYKELLNDKVCAKSFDDRVGCYIMIEALKLNTHSVNDIYYVFTVQEEIGCRGSVVAAERIQPDIGISLDVSPDHFYPSDLIGSNAVGDGVGIKFGDPSAVSDEYLLDKMLECCISNDIPFQRDVMDRGGTDSSSINKSYRGVRVVGLSIIDRFPHSQNSIVSKKDIKSAIKLIDFFTKEQFEFDEIW